MFPPRFIADGYAITEPIAEQLIALRNQYAYPRAHVAVAQDAGAFRLSETYSADFVHPDLGEVTNLELDRYHTRLLGSADPVDNLLGTLSTVFWGFYTFSPQYATVRATRHLAGYRARPPSTSDMVARCLQGASEDDLGAALGRLASLSQLGRTPFASKVIAFRFPERAGVLDNKIADGLTASPWAQGAPFLNGIGDVSQPRIQRRYAAWCDFLCQVAGRMNAGIDAGAAWHWGANEVEPQRWRAIDVERALFAHFSDDGVATV